jgi:hypothetical protein
MEWGKKWLTLIVYWRGGGGGGDDNGEQSSYQKIVEVQIVDLINFLFYTSFIKICEA